LSKFSEALDKDLTALENGQTTINQIREKWIHPHRETPPASIPYSYLGKIETNFLLTKAAAVFSFIAFVVSIFTLLWK